MVPVIAAGAAAAGGAIAGSVAAAARKGYRGENWGNSFNGDDPRKGVGGYNADAFEYGGGQGRAAAQEGTYRNLGAAAQDRQAAQADYTAANADRGLAAAMRGEQLGALDLQRQAAQGNAPSVAAIQMQAGLDQQMRGQESMRASARGAAGVAMADYGAAANTAAAQQQTVQQMGALRAQEMATARDAYMGGASGIRGQDYQGAGQAAEMAQFQTAQQMAQREANDRREAAMYAAAEGVAQTQMQGQLQQQGAMQTGYQEAQRLKQASEAGAAAQQMQAIQMGLGGVTGAASALASAYQGGGSSSSGKGKW